MQSVLQRDTFYFIAHLICYINILRFNIYCFCILGEHSLIRSEAKYGIIEMIHSTNFDVMRIFHKLILSQYTVGTWSQLNEVSINSDTWINSSFFCILVINSNSYFIICLWFGFPFIFSSKSICPFVWNQTNDILYILLLGVFPMK